MMASASTSDMLRRLLEARTVPQLKWDCLVAELPQKGNKAELVERLLRDDGAKMRAVASEAQAGAAEDGDVVMEPGDVYVAEAYAEHQVEALEDSFTVVVFGPGKVVSAALDGI